MTQRTGAVLNECKINGVHVKALFVPFFTLLDFTPTQFLPLWMLQLVFWVLASGEVWLARRMVNDFFCFLLILYMLVHLQRPAARAWFSYMRANGTEGHRLKWQRIVVALPWKNSENEWCCHVVGPHTLPMPFPPFLPSSLVCKMKAEGRVECRRRSSLGRDQPETLWLTFLFSLSLFSNHFHGCSFHFCCRCVWAYLCRCLNFFLLGLFL